MSDFEGRSTKNRSLPHLASAFGVRMTENLLRVFDGRFERVTRGESANHIQPRVVLNTAKQICPAGPELADCRLREIQLLAWQVMAFTRCRRRSNARPRPSCSAKAL